MWPISSPMQSCSLRLIRIAWYILIYALNTCECELQQQFSAPRRNLVPTNALCRSITRVLVSGPCSGKSFQYKICSFSGYSTPTEIWLDNGFESLEKFYERHCASDLDVVCKSYVHSARVSCCFCSSDWLKIMNIAI